MRGEHAEGALYWKAYAENKEGQPANALNTCGELRKNFPKSRWIDECGALEIEIRGKSGHPVSPQAEPDEDLKLLALNALMQQDQAQAIPILQKILTGNQSDQMKSRALFVLAQNPSRQAKALIGQIAQGQSNPALQVKAIRMLAIAQGKGADDTLASIYQHSADTQVKRAILQSYLMTGDTSKLLEVARQETSPELVRTAIRTLGPMGASQELLTLYRATNNAQTKAEIISALIPSGRKGASQLAEIAQSEQDPDLRRKAIRNLGIAGGMSVAPALVSTYQKNTDAETRRAAAQALFLANDAPDLVTLARAEKDPAMKEYLVQQLSLMHNEEATKYMLEILNK
jgi:HEAT repeat protein